MYVLKVLVIDDRWLHVVKWEIIVDLSRVDEQYAIAVNVVQAVLGALSQRRMFSMCSSKQFRRKSWKWFNTDISAVRWKVRKQSDICWCKVPYKCHNVIVSLKQIAFGCNPGLQMGMMADQYNVNKPTYCSSLVLAGHFVRNFRLAKRCIVVDRVAFILCDGISQIAVSEIVAL